ncbi:hypothetical protein OSB04_014016 [Centaurea solstitialis]|uniref:PGG domain-containing protein n=1 Tax=Centaurea solstitialis TaxID=347529 RepID=A0AA38WFJ9_9ASTR|nr:hypothetical protein OSB04_014016 [Centaurea solstitialis]
MRVLVNRTVGIRSFSVQFGAGCTKSLPIIEFIKNKEKNAIEDEIKPIKGKPDTSNQPLREMSDTSNQMLQEWFDSNYQWSQEMSDTSSPSLHGIEISDTSNQPLPYGTHRTHPKSIPECKHPCGDLLLDGGSRGGYIDICVPLQEASFVGDWEAAKKILDNNSQLDLLGYGISEDKETALHIAASSGNIKFIEHLVDQMTKQQLALQDVNGFTALCFATAIGNVNVVKTMVKKYSQLLTICDDSGRLPIYMAAKFGRHDMVVYLYGKYKSMADNVWTVDHIHKVFLRCIKADLFGTYCALKILDDNKEIGFPEKECAQKVLYILARKTYAFEDVKSWKDSFTWVRPAIRKSLARKLLEKIWKNILKRSSYEITHILRGPEATDEEATCPYQTLFVAAEMGNVNFLVELIRGYPDISYEKNNEEHTIFHIAVSHRHESVYNLLYEMGSVHHILTSFKDENDNNMLHLAGMKANSPFKDVSGAAFQMQRELLWFKEVDSRVPPYCRDKKNKDGRTPFQLFTENHKDMVSEGEKWMKETANQCMVVAALITTVVFSAAFTFPGGYDQSNGLPMFLIDGPFITFVILDAISLILSSSSILMFLSILTSRYAQEDFRVALPKKLMIGLTTLFLSIITMMVTFSVSFFVLYRNKLISIPIIISVGAVVPIFLYMKLQFPLLVDVYRSTYGSRYLFRPKKRVLFYRN